MRGAKGGFWDMLFSRVRKRKIQKKKNDEMKLENESLKSKKLEQTKKENNNHVLYVINVNKKANLELKNSNLKVQKKKFSGSKKITRKNASNVVKILITSSTITPKKGIDINKNNSKTSDKIETKKVTSLSNKKIKKENKKISNKVDNKKIESISNKKIKKKPSPAKLDIKVEDKKKLDDNSIKLIDELNKVIDSNRETINEIKNILDKLNNDIKEAKTTKKVEEIEQKIIILKELLNKLSETYENIKGASFSKLGVEKIDKLIEDIKKIEPNFNFNVVLDKVKPNLDYYNDMSERAIETTNMTYSTTTKKDIINYKDNKLEKMKIELKDFEKVNSRLSNELSKHDNIVKEFNELIKKISPEKIVHIQNDFLATMLHNTGCLIGAFLSIPFLKKPKNVPLFTFGLFTINNSIRSMRKVTTTEKISYIPSDDYANQIIKYKNSFGFADYMISDTLYQISEFKEEYKSNFSGYHNTDVFDKNLKTIEEMENKILTQSKKIEQLKKNYEKTLENNYKKVLSIKNNK